MSRAHRALKRDLERFIPAERLVDDPLRTLAWGTDASFYRLTPKLVVKVDNEEEVVRILGLARSHGTPVTFRAAGTSLSGQAVTDSVLLLLSGDGWQGRSVHDDGARIDLQPGVIGAAANACLAPHRRKIGPDPASINAARIGGIAANNASGMCCGTAQNSYNTLAGMRMVLADGTVLDTRDADSVALFRLRKGDLLARLAELGERTRSDEDLAGRIRHKYRLKNTTGYSLNALVDHEDPVDILQHLMIGSEGTLGFISEVSYHTVPDHPCKATALVLFPDVETACIAVARLKPTPVTAVELMDRAALRSVEHKPDMPIDLRHLDSEVAALLVDTRAETESELKRQTEAILGVLDGVPLVEPAAFTFDPEAYEALWNVRKGLFPAVGAVRETGTTVIIEDVAFPVPELAAAVRELQGLFRTYHYHEALIFGHALEGNIHFVFTQDFGSPEEVERYQGLMESVCNMVVGSYGGSLKAEHGTGRNMAPYVEMEWGSDAYRLMWELKRLLDPEGLLNPGVVLNDDPEIHLKNLKPLPAADPLVDKCIECGFCEAICPSRDLTLTPRQRITVWREIQRLEATGGDDAGRQRLQAGFDYLGLATCAVDGLCASRCPVAIDTGALTKKLRAAGQGERAERVARWVNGHFGRIETATRLGLRAAGLAQDLLGDGGLEKLSGAVTRVSRGRIPRWHPAMPRAAARVAPREQQPVNGRVVYFPSCVSRTLGPAKGDPWQAPLHECMHSLLAKAGYAAVLPERPEGLCCGMPFSSKGLPAAAEASLKALEERLWQASGEGELPVLCDTSPCTFRMIEGFERPLRLYEPAGFISEFLMPHLKRARRLDRVALHVTCTSRKLGLERTMRSLAEQCADRVILPEDEGCCGFAGDRGFTHPELNASALRRLRETIPPECSHGVSNSRTCEIGLSRHGGIPYQSIAYLVDHCFTGAGN